MKQKERWTESYKKYIAQRQTGEISDNMTDDRILIEREIPSHIRESGGGTEDRV